MNWGYHLLLDCQNGDLDRIKDPDNIKAFTKELVKNINMVAYGEPLLEHFATHDPEKGGYSLVQLIETSNITGHFVDLNGDFYIDIFSCQNFDIGIAKDTVQKYFEPKHIDDIFVYRGIGRVA